MLRVKHLNRIHDFGPMSSFEFMFVGNLVHFLSRQDFVKSKELVTRLTVRSRRGET
jgi:hypothetical protein